MPVHIKELVVRANVNDNASAAPTEPVSTGASISDELRAQIIAEAVETVMSCLREQEQR